MMRMRQQIEAQRKRADTGSSWFRLGVVSATVLAPLIARWNDLRTNSRAQSLRELAASRLSDVRDQAAERLAPVRTVASARLDDARELASARIGDARELANARLGDARELASAKFDDALDRLAQVRTPEMLRNVPPFSLAVKRAEEIKRRRRRTTMLWVAGVGVGLVAAGVTAYVITRKRMATAIEEEPMVELPQERNLAEATVGKAPAMRSSYTATAERAETTVPVQTFIPTGTATASDQARYIGNIHTMIFHDADDVAHLPAEENRIYFSSETEAIQAGYRHARAAEESSQADGE